MFLLKYELNKIPEIASSYFIFNIKKMDLSLYVIEREHKVSRNMKMVN